MQWFFDAELSSPAGIRLEFGAALLAQYGARPFVSTVGRSIERRAMERNSQRARWVALLGRHCRHPSMFAGVQVLVHAQGLGAHALAASASHLHELLARVTGTSQLHGAPKQASLSGSA